MPSYPPTAMTALSDRVAVLEAENRNLRDDLSEVKADVKSLLAIVNHAKGGWAVILLVGSFVAFIGGLLGGKAAGALGLK